MGPVPIPLDIPLALPIPRLTLELSIIFLFLLHILFVNLMVGGSILTVVHEWMGRRKPEYDRLARAIAATVTVNKSLAVVLGVGPLLVINTLYTVHFYSANILTGSAWIMVVPLVAVAFLLTYLHKYTWDTLAHAKGLHIAIGASASVLFLLIPFIFLANINLMLFPEFWPAVKGFLSAVTMPNVLPRYLHFLTASLAVTGIFLAVYFGRSGYKAEAVLKDFDRQALRCRFVNVALGATLIQLVAGPLLLFTLPSEGLSWVLIYNIGLGMILALAAIWLMWKGVAARGGVRLLSVIVLLTGTVIFMGYGRHLYREKALEAHRAAMAQRQEEHNAYVLAARMRQAAGIEMTDAEAAAHPGERTFRAVCMACHAQNTRLVGPPVTEMADIYRGDPDGFIAWVREPGRKRPDYQPMPPIKLTEDQYRAVADYVLEGTGAEGMQ